MRSSVDCGPAMVLYLLSRQGVELSYEDLMDLWNFPERFDWFANLRDSPGAHWRILRKYKVPFRKVTLSEILDGKCSVQNVAVLIHNLEHPFLVQHWVPLEKVTEESVFVHWGDGSIKEFSRELFTKLYIGGFPNCAYEVGVGNTSWTWEILYDLIIEHWYFLLVFSLLIFYLLGWRI